MGLRAAVLVAAAVGASGCSPMNSISASQLQCVFSSLGTSDARRYASLLSNKMGGAALSNTCQWAAFLGNVGTESAGLTAWTQYGCPGAPYCGRGPLQITGQSNYAFCARQPSCGCGGIESNPSEAAEPTIGVGTAYCVWQDLSGRSLSSYADGSLSGFRATACTINAGHTPCNDLNGWTSRQSYWAAANRCLGGGDGGGAAADDDAGPPPPPPGPSQYVGLECDAGAGTCIDTGTTGCSGSLMVNMCPGPADVKCCVNSGVGTSCDSGSGGTCFNRNTDSCSGTVLTGLCPGPANVVCCVPIEGVGDSCNSGSGTCINVDSNSCSGTLYTGLCPGPDNVKCCDTSSSGGSNDGYGDDYSYDVEVVVVSEQASGARTRGSDRSHTDIYIGVGVAALLAVLVGLFVARGRLQPRADTEI